MFDMDFYQRNGYLVIKDFVTAQSCYDLIGRARELIDMHWTDEFKTIFSTKDESHAQEKYFLDSGNQIRLFFEKDAFDQSGNLKYEKEKSINKIGHALHQLDDAFASFSHAPNIIQLAKQLGMSDPAILQSMYICKQPYIGGEVKCHQDSTYLYVNEHPATGFWFALEEATLDNGCLWVIPGAHKGALKSRMIRQADDQICVDVYDDSQWDMTNAIPLPVSRGSLIVLHGLLPHMSRANNSGKSRHAYTLHMMSSEHQFAGDNWLRR